MDFVPAADLLSWDQYGFCIHQEFPSVPSDEANATPRVRARDANEKLFLVLFAILAAAAVANSRAPA